MQQGLVSGHSCWWGAPFRAAAGTLSDRGVARLGAGASANGVRRDAGVCTRVVLCLGQHSHSPCERRDVCVGTLSDGRDASVGPLCGPLVAICILRYTHVIKALLLLPLSSLPGARRAAVRCHVVGPRRGSQRRTAAAAIAGGRRWGLRAKRAAVLRGQGNTQGASK